MAFASFLRLLLQRAAQEKIRQTVVDAAQAKMAESVAEDSAENLACDVAVVMALGIEAGGLEDRLRDKLTLRGSGLSVRRGTIKGRRVAVVRSGPGQDAAAGATVALLNAWQPRWVISAGFAGGLTPDLAPKHLVVADRLLRGDAEPLAVDVSRVPAELRDLEVVHTGPLVCVERIIRTPAEKRRLGAATGALAAEMESYAVVDVCRQRGVSCLAVRVISDAVDDELPADVDRLLQQKSPAAQWGAALGAIVKRPGSVKDLYRLQQAAIAASERLGKYLERVIVGLIPPPEPSAADANRP